MYRLLSFLLLLAAAAPAHGKGPEMRGCLKFNGNGTFRIVQFTDLHLNAESPLGDSTAQLMRHIFIAERPDLVVVTGDIVTAPPARESWGRLAAVMSGAGIPWTVTLGNHDSEADMARSEIFEYLSAVPFFVGSSEAGLTGVGNHTLEIASGDGRRTAALLYMLDTHNMPPAHKLGHYDWIRFDQTAWYRDTARSYAAKNGGAPVPALMFLHIPLREYAEGVEHARVSASELNSGLFASLVEMGDVMGVFAGHDHSHDYVNKHMDIALAYGRVSGYDAAGHLERGARVIELHEDEFGFDTWITTPGGTGHVWFFPSAITSEEEARMEYLPAADVEPREQGVDYVYYEGRGTGFRSTSDIVRAREAGRGTLPNISIGPAAAQDSVAFVFTAWIKIPKDGVYNFYTFSDDGSMLLIDGRTVVDNDGSHSLRRHDGRIALRGGFHRLEVRWFDDYMGQWLEVGWSGREVCEAPLPDNILFRAVTR